MSEKIKILHWINLSRMFRCHLGFENDNIFTHYYITDEARNNLKTKPNVFAGPTRDITFLTDLLEKIKPHVIITSNLISSNLMQLMKDHCDQLVYISHTIWTEQVIAARLIGPKTFCEAYSIFDRMYFLPKEIAMWRKLGMSEEKIHMVNGLTYMDPILMFDHDWTKNKIRETFLEDQKPQKYLMLIHNNTQTGCLNLTGQPKDQERNSNEYGLMLKEMVDWCKVNNGHVFAKIGRRSNTLTETNLIKELHGDPHVSVVRPEEDYLLSDFLFCDVIINQSYSAAYQESLLATAYVACCYLNGKELIPCKKYPDLPVIRGISEIQPMIDQMINHREKFITSKIEAQREQIIIDTFGCKPENVTLRILDDLKKIDFKKN